MRVKTDVPCPQAVFESSMRMHDGADYGAMTRRLVVLRGSFITLLALLYVLDMEIQPRMTYQGH